MAEALWVGGFRLRLVQRSGELVVAVLRSRALVALALSLVLSMSHATGAHAAPKSFALDSLELVPGAPKYACIERRGALRPMEILRKKKRRNLALVETINRAQRKSCKSILKAQSKPRRAKRRQVVYSRKELRTCRALVGAIDYCKDRTWVEQCGLSVTPTNVMVADGGSERTFPLSVHGSCEGTPSVELVQHSPNLEVHAQPLSLTLRKLSAGEGTIEVRPCMSRGDTPLCVAPISISVSGCTVQAAGAHFSLTERDVSEFSLPASSSCGGAVAVEMVNLPPRSTVAVVGGSRVRIEGALGEGIETFSYRLCDIEFGACSNPAIVTLSVRNGGSFLGREDSLAPYKEAISMEEKRHLVRKVASNAQFLLEGDAVSLSLSEFVRDRVMNEKFVAPDLQRELEFLRDEGKIYKVPLSSEEFIPGWESDFGDGKDQAPMIHPDQDLAHVDAQIDAFNRWQVKVQRARHSGNYRYHWGWDYMAAYYLTRNRYLSPFHSNMLHYWLGHFGTNTLVVSGFHENWVGYYVKTVERDAVGSLRRMMLGDTETGCELTDGATTGAYGIICDAASNTFLDNQLNTGANENFARELMELYLMGPEDSVTGLRNYLDEGPYSDIQAAAKFVSGMRVRTKKVNGQNVDVLRYDPGRHDATPMSAFQHLESVYPDVVVRDRNMTPPEFISHLLDHHPGVARFIGRRLFASFVYPNPSDSLVYELGELLRSLDYDLHAFMERLLTSEAMYSARAREPECVLSPLQVFARFINSLSLPLFVGENQESASTYYRVQLSSRLDKAGEILLGYPSVFSYGYCGRDEGVDGTLEWLKPYLMVFRNTAFTQFLNDHYGKFASAYSAAAISARILGKDVATEVTPESFINFFDQRFDLQLVEEEREILRKYLTHRRNSSGTLTPVNWNPTDSQLMREKWAGMLLIVMNHPRANM